MKPVPNIPPLPYPGRGTSLQSLAGFDQDLVRALSAYLSDMARRANGSIPLDGSETATELNVSGDANFTGGIALGSGVSSAPEDLSRHIALWGTSYGFSITSSQLNYVAAVNASHVWYDGAGNELWRINDATSEVGTSTMKMILGYGGDITSASSTNHAFQIGLTTGLNVAYDTNEMQSRNNGAAAGYIINQFGGNLNFGGVGLDQALVVNPGRIQFPSTQNPSTNANTLDDYKEGDWTPTLAFGGASTGITYSTQQGTYVKIGRVVAFQFRLIITSKGTATGNVAILGLPFASDNYHPITFGYGTNFTGLTGVITGYMENNSANITLRQSAATGTGPILTDAVFTANTDMIISGTYIAQA